jgi:hypothetical protein
LCGIRAVAHKDHDAILAAPGDCAVLGVRFDTHDVVPCVAESSGEPRAEAAEPAHDHVVRVEPHAETRQLLAQQSRQRAQSRAGRHRRGQEARDFELPRDRRRDCARMDDEELEREVEVVQEAARLPERPRVEIEPDPPKHKGGKK